MSRLSLSDRTGRGHRTAGGDHHDELEDHYDRGTDPGAPPASGSSTRRLWQAAGGIERTWRGLLQWRLLGAFAVAFTLLFAFVAAWVLQYTADVAQHRLEYELKSAAVGLADTLDGDRVMRLVSTVAAVPDATNLTGLGYPDSADYWLLARDLWVAYRTVPELNPYMYFRDPDDGRLYFSVSGGAMVQPPTGVPYRVPVDQIVPDSAYALMEAGLEGTTMQAAYTDAYGTWMSAYTPVVDAQGIVVGALGVDYPMTYVEQVHADVRRNLLPALGLAYLVTLALVMALATLLSRPLSRLTASLQRIASGDYDTRDLDLPAFPDEMARLGGAFTQMKAAVAQRETALARQVQDLQADLARMRRLAAGQVGTGVQGPTGEGPAR